MWLIRSVALLTTGSYIFNTTLVTPTMLIKTYNYNPPIYEGSSETSNGTTKLQISIPVNSNIT